jgi:photosystem II stability/assembly factor-like uncharacterized protein
MALILSHGGNTSFTSSTPSNEILVGTTEGVVFIKRESTSSQWWVAHRALSDKHVHAILVDPVSGTILVGAARDGIFASVDRGQNWEHRDDGLTQKDVYSLAASQVSGHIRIFAGTEPAHLFSSDDLGRHWTELPSLRSVDTSRWFFPGPPYIAHTKHINFRPNDPNILFIGIEVGGLLKSVDGGQNFHSISGVDPDVHRTVFNPLNPDRIYVTGGDGIYVTSDGGDCWEHLTTTAHEIGGYPDFLLVHPRRPELVFVAAAHHGPGSWRESRYAGTRISKSSDGGKTWQPLRNGLPDRLQTAVEAMCLEDWGDGFSLFAATATGEIWSSEDGGQNWSVIIRGLAPISKGDHYAMLVAG